MERVNVAIAGTFAFIFGFLCTWCLVAASSRGDEITHDVSRCERCGEVAHFGFLLCARCRTAETLGGETYEEWAASRQPVFWRRF